MLVEGDRTATATFVAPHLHFIVFELLKNALRSTMLRHQHSDAQRLVRARVRCGRSAAHAAAFAAPPRASQPPVRVAIGADTSHASIGCVSPGLLQHPNCGPALTVRRRRRAAFKTRAWACR